MREMRAIVSANVRITSSEHAYATSNGPKIVQSVHMSIYTSYKAFFLWNLRFFAPHVFQHRLHHRHAHSHVNGAVVVVHLLEHFIQQRVAQDVINA